MNEDKYWAGIARCCPKFYSDLAVLLAHFGSPVKLWNASYSEIRKVPGIRARLLREFVETRSALNLENEYSRIKENNIRIVAINDPHYPQLLKNIYDPPLVLFIKGTALTDEKRCLAVVGARQPSHYGIKVTREIVQELVKQNFTIVSGFAYGIDTASHRIALENRGKTIAVMGCGLDICYPQVNRKLFDQIAESGTLVSEFPPGTPPLPQNFPRRNRIISGISQGTLVIEAKQRSGSLITAKHALEQGREVFAVPGEISSPLSQGTNCLIKRGEAKLVQNVNDILEEFGYNNQHIFPREREDKSTDQQPKLQNIEEKNVYELIRKRVEKVEDICEKTGYPMSKVTSILINLEMNGCIERTPGGYYVLADRNRP